MRPGFSSALLDGICGLIEAVRASRCFLSASKYILGAFNHQPMVCARSLLVARCIHAGQLVSLVPRKQAFNSKRQAFSFPE